MSGYGLRVLRREAANTTTSIQSRCRRAASQDFPDRFAQEYLRGLHDLAELLYKEITALSNDPSLEYQDKRRQARGHLRYLRKISEWVRFADSAHVATTPWSIILPLKKLVHPLIGDCEFLVRSKWRWNYQILRNVVQFVRDDILDHVEIRESHQDLYLKLESFITSWGEDCCVISLPYVDRKNVLRHVLFGHEIGHLVAAPILRAYWAAHKSDVENVLSQDVIAKTKAQSGNSTSSKNPSLAREVDAAVQCIKRAVEEILCDLTAVRLFGPVAVLAALEVATLKDPDLPPTEQGKWYPPWRLRLREMMRIADPDFFDKPNAPLDLEPRWLKHLETWTEDGVTHHALLSQIKARVMSAWVRLRKLTNFDPHNYAPLRVKTEPFRTLALPDLYDHILNTSLPATRTELLVKIDASLPEERYEPKRIAELLVRLYNDIPPDSVRVAKGQWSVASLKEVFTAGWLYYLHVIDEEEFLSDRNQQDKLNRLLLKAVESAELERDYRSWQSPKREA